IDSKTGTTCNDQLNATWAPAITLSKVLVEMRALLERPNYDVPVEGDNLEGKNEEKARLWTAEFAQPSNL
ncbi:unnamed protein product, partial [Rotaria magnacalcarata]